MTERSILLYGGDKPGSRRIASCLRATGKEVHRLDELEPALFLLEEGSVDLVLVDQDNAAEATIILEAAEGWIPALTLTSQATATDLLYTVFGQGVSYLVANLGADGSPLHTVSEQDLVVTIEKILRGDLFGLHKYMPAFGTEMRRIEVRRTEDRDEVVAAVEDYLRKRGAGRKVLSAVALIADELTTNAIYNAPRAPDGRPRYRDVSRREKIVLAPSEYVQVELASDGRRFGIGVTDRFGALTGKYLRAGLRQCLASHQASPRRTRGSGLGLRTVLHSCSELVINVEPGTRTEVLSFVDLKHGRQRDHGRCLQLFVGSSRPSAAMRGAAATASTPAISPRARRRWPVGTSAGAETEATSGKCTPLHSASVRKAPARPCSHEIDAGWDLPQNQRACAASA